jgi:hypothetical protein
MTECPASPRPKFITPSGTLPPMNLEQLELKIIENDLDRQTNLNIDQNQFAGVKVTSVTKKKKTITKVSETPFALQTGNNAEIQPKSKTVCTKSDILVVNSKIMDIKSELATQDATKEFDIRNCDTILTTEKDKPMELQVPCITATEDVEPDSSTDCKFKPLTIDVLNANFEVVTNLQRGKKLQIADGIYFRADDRYAQSLTRYLSGDSKDAVVDLMDHMYSETERHINKIREDIRQNICVDINITLLHGFITKMHAFIHTLDNVKSIYENYINICARFNVIKAKFLDFSAVLFRELILAKINADLK